ncbi:MAG: hypothetical protein QXE51_00085 [Nitrososphaeria archaeon]
MDRDLYIELFINEYLKPITKESIASALEFMENVQFLDVVYLAQKAKETGRTDLYDLARELYKIHIISAIPDVEVYVDINNMTMKKEKIAFIRYLLTLGFGSTPEKRPVDPTIAKFFELLSLDPIWFEIAEKETIRSLTVQKKRGE